MWGVELESSLVEGCKEEEKEEEKEEVEAGHEKVKAVEAGGGKEYTTGGLRVNSRGSSVAREGGIKDLEVVACSDCLIADGVAL